MHVPCLIALIALASIATHDVVAFGETKAEASPKPHELVGFLLRQTRAAIENSLGKPFDRQKDRDGCTGFAYHVQEGQGSYLIAFYGKRDRVLKLELTGADYHGPTGFFGLRLGDAADRVEAAIGRPERVSHEDDVNVDLWEYKDATYSVEMSADHRLYSIQIVDGDKSLPKGFPSKNTVYTFAKAIASHDIDTVMDMASGELECSEEGAHGIQARGARQVLTDPQDAISQCLQRAAKAIFALGSEMKGTDDSLRMWPDVGEVGAVVKFPANSRLKEVVFINESRAWRVYEVTFRARDGRKKSPMAFSRLD